MQMDFTTIDIVKIIIHTNCTMCLKIFLWWSGGRGGLAAGSRAGAVSHGWVRCFSTISLLRLHSTTRTVRKGVRAQTHNEKD